MNPDTLWIVFGDDTVAYRVVTEGAQMVTVTSAGWWWAAGILFGIAFIWWVAR